MLFSDYSLASGNKKEKSCFGKKQLKERRIFGCWPGDVTPTKPAPYPAKCLNTNAEPLNSASRHLAEVKRVPPKPQRRDCRKQSTMPIGWHPPRLGYKPPLMPGIFERARNKSWLNDTHFSCKRQEPTHLAAFGSGKEQLMKLQNLGFGDAHG